MIFEGKYKFSVKFLVFRILRVVIFGEVIVEL